MRDSGLIPATSPHGVQAEAVHPAYEPQNRQGAGRRSVERGRPCRIGRDERHARAWAGQGRHAGGELGVSDPDARPQVFGQRPEERVDHPVLAAVQALKSVQADVGGAEARTFSTRSLILLQCGEHAAELPPVRRLVGFEDDGPGVAGERLLQCHAQHHSGTGREVVSDQRPPTGVVGDDDRFVSQVRLPLQFDLRPEMGDQHTRDAQDALPLNACYPSRD